MSGRAPSGTYTRPGAARAPIVVPAQKSDRASFCGCCCSMQRQALLVLLAFGYLGILIMSAVSVGAGVDDHMTVYRGQINVNTANYKITEVKAKSLRIWTGWLKYNDGISKSGPKDLSSLSTGSAILGFLVAFLLLCSLIVAAWKLCSILCCGRLFARRSTVCPAVTFSLVIIIILTVFYVVTSRDVDDFAHKSLGVPNQNSVAMVPDYAWYNGFFAGVLWLFVAIFSAGLPKDAAQEYHQF